MTTSNERLTFDQFQATGRDMDDLRVSAPHLFEHEVAVPGRLYVRDLAITRNADPDTAARGTWAVETACWMHYGELAAVEAELYAFYVSECADEEVRAYLMDAAPEAKYGLARDKQPDRKALTAIYEGFGCFHGYDLGCAEEMAIEGCDNAGKAFPPEHLQWIGAFIRRWEAMEAADAAAREKGTKSDTDGVQLQQVYAHLLDVAEKRVSSYREGYAEGRAALDTLSNLIAAAQRADGDERPGRPERGPGYSDEQWELVMRGWDMHADAVFRSGLRDVLLTLAADDRVARA